MFWPHSQESDDHGCVALFLGPLIYAIALNVCVFFKASAMLFLLLWLCSIILKPGIVISSALLLLLLFQVFHALI
jgi:hypothetical protein